MKATYKLVAFSAGAVLLIALVAGASFWSFGRIVKEGAARDQISNVIQLSDDVLSTMKDAETGQRGYALTGDATFLEPYLAAKDSISSQLKTLRQLSAMKTDRANLDAVTLLVDAKFAELYKVIELRRNGDMAGAIAVVKAGQGKRLMDSIRVEMRAFLKIQENAAAQSEAEFQNSMRDLLLVIVAITVLMSLLALSLAYFTYRDSQHQLKDLVYLETKHLLEVQEETNKKLQHANLTLSISEEKLAVTLHSIGDAVIATNAEGLVVLLNPLAEQLTGWTQAQATDRPLKEIFHIVDHETRQRAPIPITETLAHGTIQGLANDTILIARDGSECAIADSCAPIRDRNGQVVGAVLVFRDVTETKRFERALQDKNVELEHATRMKSEFLATMSHELRTPLNAIIGFSEALKDGLIGELSDTQKEYIGDIFSSGRHLLSLINDILDLSKVEAGMMTLEIEDVDVKSLLASSLSIVKEKASVQQIQVELEIGEDLGMPRLDMRKTKQIVYNLLSNAIKFTPNAGHVTMRARRVLRSAVGTLGKGWPVHAFPLAANEHEEFLEISVSDTGIGISEMNMAKLFQPFIQIDSSLARKFGGTGLGLAMVKQLAELHGGTVAVASAEGEGSIFAAWLPLRQAGEAGTALPLISGEAAAPDGRVVLMVEQDDKAAELLRLLLEAEGFRVLRAASAEAALLLAPQQTLNLITLAIELPGIDGWEFLRRIGGNDALSSVPVVVVAATDYRDMALGRGAAAVLQKPVSRAQLKDSLQHMGLQPVPQHTHTVLIVDDDPKAVDLIATFLPAPAYAVVRAYGGSEAIALARQLHPDLILLDLMMPEVSGFDVVDALQRDVDTARIPVLVVTAKQITPQDRVALNRQAGNLVRIVEKAGFDKQRFMAEVRRALEPPITPD